MLADLSIRSALNQGSRRVFFEPRCSTSLPNPVVFDGGAHASAGTFWIRPGRAQLRARGGIGLSPTFLGGRPWFSDLWLLARRGCCNRDAQHDRLAGRTALRDTSPVGVRSARHFLTMPCELGDG